MKDIKIKIGKFFLKLGIGNDSIWNDRDELVVADCDEIVYDRDPKKRPKKIAVRQGEKWRIIDVEKGIVYPFTNIPYWKRIAFLGENRIAIEDRISIYSSCDSDQNLCYDAYIADFYGNLIIDEKFDIVGKFKMGKAVVKRRNDQENFISPNGDFLLKDDVSAVDSFDGNGFAVIFKRKNKDRFANLVNLNGEFLLEDFKWKLCECLNRKLGLYILMDRDFKTYLFDLKSREITYLSDRAMLFRHRGYPAILKIQIGDKYNAIDWKGNYIFSENVASLDLKVPIFKVSFKENALIGVCSANRRIEVSFEEIINREILKIALSKFQ